MLYCLHTLIAELTGYSAFAEPARPFSEYAKTIEPFSEHAKSIKSFSVMNQTAENQKQIGKEVFTMSYKELAHSLIDQIPESRLYYVILYLQGAAVPDETPNAETLEAMAEVDEMIRTGSGEHFSGSTADFFAALERD